MQSRRTVLRAGVGGIAGMSLGIPALRATVANAQTAAVVVTRPLSDDLHVLTVGQSNVLALTGEDGVALVDGGPPGSTDAVLRAVAALPAGGKIQMLFNTHWHPEQTGSNERLAAGGATIIAQENTRLWLTTDIAYPWDGQTFEPLPAQAHPNRTFYDRDNLSFGAENIECGHLHHAAHTDGDLYVRFAQANVLAVGGAASGDGWPLIDWWTGGWIGGVVGGLEMLLALSDAQTRIVPASGRVLSRADLEIQLDMYGSIYERLSRLLNSGRGPAEAVAAAPTKEFDATMGPPEEFVMRAFESLWAYLAPDA